MAFHAVYWFFATEKVYLNLFDTKKRVLNIETFVQVRNQRPIKTYYAIICFTGVWGKLQILQKKANINWVECIINPGLKNLLWPQDLRTPSVRLCTLCRPADQSCSGRSGTPPSLINPAQTNQANLVAWSNWSCLTKQAAAISKSGKRLIDQDPRL